MKKPTGYIATCQCGVNIGAIDLVRTEGKEAGKLLGIWIANGCVLTPKFKDFRVELDECQCGAPEVKYG